MLSNAHHDSNSKRHAERLSKIHSLHPEGGEVVITDNGKEIGKFVPKVKSATPLTDSMIGILKSEDSVEEERENYLRQKYEIDN